MPKNLMASTDAAKSRLIKIIMGAGAALAFLATLVSNYQKIVDFILPPNNVRVGWLSVADPTTLKECVLVKDQNIFKLSNNREVQLASTACLTELRALLPSSAPGTVEEQKINSSYFLMVENQGEQIDRLTLKPAPGSGENQEMVFRDVGKGASIAICMGYDGNGGTPSKMSDVVEIDVKRNAKMAFDVEVPKRHQGTAIGVSDCGSIVWNYPE